MRLIERPIYLERLKRVKGSTDIKIITGIRRCGKSKLLAAFEDYIRAAESSANIISIDLTKLRFEELKNYHKLNDYVESCYKAGASNYVLIDEVQLCDKFELVINSLHSEEKYDIYLTGSNAFLLSSDLATLFTGRHIDIHVFPFSFREYLNYFGESADLQGQLTSYIKTGGMAGAYVYPEETDREKYVRDVYDTILLRDLVDKYKLGNAALLHKVGDFMMDNVGNITSGRNITEGLKAGDTETNHVTVGNYISYLNNAFVFYEAKRYDIKGKAYLQSLGKQYLADTGLRYAELGKRNMDWGRMLENIVYIELLRRGYNVYVGKLYKKEIDFVAMKGTEKLYIQVSDDITSPETFKRETEPLLQIRDVYPKLLLARTASESTDYEGIAITDIANWLIG